ncbi:MAG TPA: RNA methyltransferase [Geobacterales bacterium]|nr:RNA methyltransferase [Geobacterales bacterium]
MPIRDQLTVILVEPQSPGNVGMVCRAMKNMGLSSLRLVGGCATDHPEARKFAVAASDLLEQAVRFATLAEALADTELSIATTRRRGKYRQELIPLDQLAERVEAAAVTGRIAVVFGREDSGLTTDELTICRWQATIATADEYGSLNLAQAVLLFCYELSQQERQAQVVESPRQRASAEELEALYTHMARTLLNIGYLNPQNPTHIMHGVRRILDRAAMDSREVTIFRGMMNQVDWAADHFKGKKQRS